MLTRRANKLGKITNRDEWKISMSRPHLLSVSTGWSNVLIIAQSLTNVICVSDYAWHTWHSGAVALRSGPYTTKLNKVSYRKQIARQYSFHQKFGHAGSVVDHVKVSSQFDHHARFSCCFSRCVRACGPKNFADAGARPPLGTGQCRDLEIRVKGHSRSLRMVSFDRLCIISY